MSTTEDDVKLMTEGAAQHMQRMQNWFSIQIHRSERNSDGWLEWLLVYEFTNGGRLTVGMLQRRPGEKLEFHS